MVVLEKIRTECDRASDIIRSTRATLRQQVSKPTLIITTELLSELETLVTDRLAVLGVSIAKFVDPGAAHFVADRTQISQALYNLLDNSLQAIDASGKAGAVTVDVRPRMPAEISFEVRDTGPGFPAETSGSQLPPYISTRIDGSGIGLSIVRSVAEAHGGRLSIERRDGTTCVRFTIASNN